MALSPEDEKLVDEIIAQIDLVGWSILVNGTAEHLGEVARAAGANSLISVGFKTDADANLFTVVNDHAVEFANARAAELVGMKYVDGELIENPDARWAITDGTREFLRGQVSRAIEEGWSSKQLQDSIEESYAFSPSRADMIARTEIARAQEQGHLQGWKDSGVVSSKRIVLDPAHDIDDECSDAAAMEAVPLDDDFDGLGDPPLHPNCLVEGTIVAASSRISTVFKRWYEGQTVTLTVAGNHRLTCTPNHPILTQRGWVSACQIAKTDDLVFCIEPSIVSAVGVNDYQMPARVEDVARAHLSARDVTRVAQVPSAPEQFHGDGSVHGQVDIIRPASRLVLDSQRDESISHLLFIGIDLRDSLNSFRPFALMLKRLLDAPHSIVRRLCVGLSDFWRERSIANELRFGLCANGDAITSQVPINHLRMDAESSAESNSAIASCISRAQRANVAWGQAIASIDNDSSLTQMAQDGTLIAAITDRYLKRSLAPFIRFRHIIDVDRIGQYAGHVYNLETADAYYIAGGAVVHNCKCVLVAFTEQPTEGDDEND